MEENYQNLEKEKYLKDIDDELLRKIKPEVEFKLHVCKKIY